MGPPNELPNLSHQVIWEVPGAVAGHQLLDSTDAASRTEISTTLVSTVTRKLAAPS